MSDNPGNIANIIHDSPVTDVSRRRFMTMAGGVLIGSQLPSSSLIFAKPPKRKIKVGVIGCGGRGRFIAQLMVTHGNFEIVAAADYFQDQVQAFAKDFHLSTKQLHTGLGGYQKLLHEKLDAVVISCPPFFHPKQTAAANDAGKHVFLAKPVAVDMPGCQLIEKAAQTATKNAQVLLVDFQTRANPFYTQAIKRVHQGAIGKLTFIDAKNHERRFNAKVKPDGQPETRLRNWLFDKALSGDIIVEQHVHALDIVSWVMNQAPLSASGVCGRKSRIDVGDCNDYFALLLKYPDNVGVTFSGKQYDDGANPEGIVVNAFGSQGRLQTKYGGRVVILGKQYYRGGNTGQIYKDATVANVADFYNRIVAGQADNPTVKPSVQSTQVALLGRQAAYTGQVVHWKKLMQSVDRLDGQLEGLKQ